MEDDLFGDEVPIQKPIAPPVQVRKPVAPPQPATPIPAHTKVKQEQPIIQQPSVGNVMRDDDI